MISFLFRNPNEPPAAGGGGRQKAKVQDSAEWPVYDVDNQNLFHIGQSFVLRLRCAINN